eukprot:TRINITY_DN5588_c0_g1_i1.p1 TRINITY_DN5588_c0_g1~~TRINITY_DN5588_c0_g1_i1.p1  ORF type:complete len:543 (-),score=185.83 TRINITY_DN5588_c0_g1_i1:397-2025(-)
MDEVDGMAGGDRGGNAALIKMIKHTKNPIICICNDHSSPKVRTLAFSCYDVRFTRPTKTTIAQRVAEIAAAEGLDCDPIALEALAESCGNDIRHVINQLQAMSASAAYVAGGVNYTDMKGRIREIQKDQMAMVSPFEACKQLLASSSVRSMSPNEGLDRFFVDFNLMNLLLQENYLNAVSKMEANADLLERCAKSAALIAEGDLLSRQIRDKQQWDLLPSMGFISTVYPAKITHGFVPFPDFPKFLGNYSKQSRARRLALELHVFLRLGGTVSRRTLATSGYLSALLQKAVKPLQEEEDIDGAVAVLDAYGLQRGHLAEHLSELQSHLVEGEDAFKAVDPKVKAALTREMNTGGHAVRVVLPATKKRKGGPIVPEGDDLGEGDEIEGAAEKAPPAENEGEAKSDDEQLGGLVKKAKAKKKSSASGKAKAKGKASRDASPEPPEPAAKKSKTTTGGAAAKASTAPSSSKASAATAAAGSGKKEKPVSDAVAKAQAAARAAEEAAAAAAARLKALTAGAKAAAKADSKAKAKAKGSDAKAKRKA